MTLLQYVQILAVVTLMTCGQLLFRKSAVGGPPLSTLHGLTTLFLNPFFILALVIYAGATLLWVSVLQQVPLSRAFAFNALSFVVIPIASILFFGEVATPRLGMGLALVIAGLILVGGGN